MKSPLVHLFPPIFMLSKKSTCHPFPPIFMLCKKSTCPLVRAINQEEKKKWAKEKKIKSSAMIPPKSSHFFKCMKPKRKFITTQSQKMCEILGLGLGFSALVACSSRPAKKEQAHEWLPPVHCKIVASNPQFIQCKNWILKLWVNQHWYYDKNQCWSFFLFFLFF